MEVPDVAKHTQHPAAAAAMSGSGFYKLLTYCAVFC